jgi:TonB family protein
MKCSSLLLPTTIALALATSLPTRTEAAPQEADSTRLYGAWRWIESGGGFGSGRPQTPTTCGCERLLTITRSGTYELVERDSSHEYLLCRGRFSVHPGSGLSLGDAPADFWIRFENWWVGYEGDQLVRFLDPGADSILTYPGGAGHGVDDAPAHHFVRWVKPIFPGSTGRPVTRLSLRARPKRPAPEDLPGEGDFVYYEEPPVPITVIRPGWPEVISDRPINAVVLLHVLVGKDGRVKDVKVMRDVQSLSRVAVDAVRQWVFKPALSNNKAVAVWIEVPMSFPP